MEAEFMLVVFGEVLNLPPVPLPSRVHTLALYTFRSWLVIGFSLPVASSGF